MLTLEHLVLATFYTDLVKDASKEITSTPKFDSLIVCLGKHDVKKQTP